MSILAYVEGESAFLEAWSGGITHQDISEISELIDDKMIKDELEKILSGLLADDNQTQKSITNQTTPH